MGCGAVPIYYALQPIISLPCVNYFFVEILFFIRFNVGDMIKYNLLKRVLLKLSLPNPCFSETSPSSI